MCKPTHFDVTEKDAHGNAHMDPENRPDRTLARKQHHALVALYKSLGVSVTLIEPVEGLPDMTFTANCGFAFKKDGKPCAIISSFRPERRQGEEGLFRDFFKKRFYRTFRLPPDVYFEGAGDAIPFGNVIFMGHGFRTSLGAAPFLAHLTGKTVIPLKLKASDEGSAIQYHLDTAMTVFEKERTIIAYRGAFTKLSWKGLVYEVAKAGGRLFEASYDDAASLALNTFVIPRDDIALRENAGDALSSEIRRSIVDLAVIRRERSRTDRQFRGVAITSNTASAHLIITMRECGYLPITLPLSEFIKSGGGAFCLTKILC